MFIKSSFHLYSRLNFQDSYDARVEFGRTHAPHPFFHDSYIHNTPKWLKNVSFIIHLCLIVLPRANLTQLGPIKSTIDLEEVSQWVVSRVANSAPRRSICLSRRKTLVPQRLDTKRNYGRGTVVAKPNAFHCGVTDLLQQARNVVVSLGSQRSYRLSTVSKNNIC